jgi:hypothetical protein
MKSFHSFVVLGTLTLLGCVQSFLNAQVPQGSERAEMLRAAEWYQRNRDSFHNLKCRFVAKDYACKTIKDAIEGKALGRETMVNNGLWIVRGSEEQYSLGDISVIQRAFADLREHKGGAEKLSNLAVPCLHSDYLSNGRYKLNVASIGCADFYEEGKGDQPRGSKLVTPMNLGFLHPPDDLASLLGDAISGKQYGRLEGTQVIDGHKVLVFSVGKSRDEIRMRMFLDPARGFLPLRIDSYLPGTDVRHQSSAITDAKQCSGNRWFPMRGVVVLNANQEGKVDLYIRITTVLSLDADTAPADEDFVTVIESGCQVKDPHRPRAIYIEKSTKTVTLDGLNELAKKLDRLANRPNGIQ